MPDLTLLVLGDFHYCSRANLSDEAGSRRVMGLELVQRALNDGMRLCKPDAVVVLGDVVDDGAHPSAETDLTAVAKVVRDACPHVIAVPGNHDDNPRRFLRIFQDEPGLHNVGGHSIYTFADRYADDDAMTRHEYATKSFRKQRMHGPVIVIQHSPIYPDVDCSEYPYMPLNRDEIMESYRDKGVALSLSGHFHEGQPPASKDGTIYATVPSLSDAPFQFGIVRIEDGKVDVEFHRLKHAQFEQFTDGHIHTPFGYCAVDVHPTPARERLELLGIKRAVLVEHSPQLYLADKDFWNAQHVEKPDAIRKSRENGTFRLDAFRNKMNDFRDGFFQIGLETELDREGKLTLLDEDRSGWDRILGAVHWIPSNMPFATQAQQEQTFMALIDGLTSSGISVLAHPFRYFHHKRLPRPTALYKPVAKLLRERNVAAEVNFHYNQPDPEFFRICLEEGVKIAVGSDSHCLYEVGDLAPHLRLLKEIGAIPSEA